MDHRKIAIIGNAGSGKSTFALKLHRLLNIPLYHLDQYFWKPGWQEPNREEFEKIHNTLCNQHAWIIEGMAIRFFEYRMQCADIIIFLDIPPYKCLYRVYKRAFIYRGKQYFSNARDCPERLPDLKFLKFIWNFNKERKPVIKKLLQQYNHKQVYLIRNQYQLDQFYTK